MAKFHINPSTGNPGECSATVKDCPFGSADEHFGSPEEARAAYETMMSSQPVLPAKRTRVLDKDTYVSVFTPTKDLLTEDYPKELASSLEPGEYAALYHDSKSGADRYIKITVSGGDEVEFERISGFKKISSPSTPRTQAAVSQGLSELERLEDVSNPSYCKQNSVDRITLLESSQATRRILAKFDWNTADGAFQGRRELEDLEWVLDHDLDLAEREGKRDEMNALKESKRIVGDLVTELSKRGS